MDLARFFAELKRRSVYKVAVAYVVVGWLLIQVATQTFPVFEIPNWVARAVILILCLGFPVALILAWAFELTPEGIKRADEAVAVTTRAKTPWIWTLVVVSAGAISIALFLAGRQTGRNQDDAAASPAKSIAVLPFENLSRDPDNAYFAEGIQDEILTRLAKISDLKVISRTSTHRYRSSPEDLPEIAEQLGVAHILEGSVQKSGDQVRVTVQLIRAATDSHVWAETYDRKLTDIFAVESEVASNIARSLRAQLTSAEQQAIGARPTENPEAYEAYLRGLALWNGLSASPQDFDTTVLYLDRATHLDPGFALAWALLAVAHTYIYAEYEGTPRRLARAKAALDTAAELDPDSGDTQFALGMYRYRGLGDYEGALSAFRNARERGAATRVEAIEFSAYVKRRQNKWDEALALHAESLELDPRNPILLSESALTYRAVRRLTEARDLVDRALEIEPANAYLLLQKAEIHVAEGDLAKATELLEPLPVDGQDPTVFGARIRLWMFAGRYGDAIEALRKVVDAPETFPRAFVPSYRSWLGIAETLAGDTDAAAVELARAQTDLIALRAGGDTGTRIAHDLILTAGFMRDKASVDREAADIQDEIANDAVAGPGLEEAIAVARAQLGETDAAIASVGHLLEVYGEMSLTPGLLRLDPWWNPLRSDPRFTELAALKSSGKPGAGGVPRQEN